MKPVEIDFFDLTFLMMILLKGERTFAAGCERWTRTVIGINLEGQYHQHTDEWRLSGRVVDQPDQTWRVQFTFDFDAYRDRQTPKDSIGLNHFGYQWGSVSQAFIQGIDAYKRAVTNLRVSEPTPDTYHTIKEFEIVD